MVPCSAAAELTLLEARAAGTVEYSLGAGKATADGADAKVADALRVLEQWGSTGALESLSAAVALRPPTLAFPVAALDTLAPLGAPPDAPPLRDCLQMKPLSTAGDVYEAAKKAGLCSGDFVRAEAIRANEWVAGAAPNFPVKRLSLIHI